MVNEEGKYTIIGKVEIGTDEYRDLIESNVRLNQERSDANSRYWKEEAKRKELEKELSLVKKRLTDYTSFMTDRGLFNDFKMWTIEKQITEENKNADTEN